jgi:hypothetical protein
MMVMRVKWLSQVPGVSMPLRLAVRVATVTIAWVPLGGCVESLVVVQSALLRYSGRFDLLQMLLEYSSTRVLYYYWCALYLLLDHECHERTH